MKHTHLIGTGVALVTPFRADKSVDVQSLEKLVDYVITNGAEYLVVLGTTAETATLTLEEKQMVKQIIKESNAQRVPMMLGIGGNNTQSVIEQIQSTDLSDYECILSVSPYYNKPSQEGIYQHYSAIAQSTSHPIVLYNVPGRTGVNMSSQTTLRLAHQYPNIIGTKEASGNIVQFMEIVQHKPQDFLVISGDDMTALASVLMGGSGVISVIAQGYPEYFSQMIRHALSGNTKQATELHYKLMESFDLIFEEGNPCGIKSLLQIKGICQDIVRLPLVSASCELKEKLQNFSQNII